MPRLVIKMAFMCAVAFGLLLSCLTNLEELPGDFPQDIAMNKEVGAADTTSLRHQMAYMVEVSRVLQEVAASPGLAGKYAAAGDTAALLVAQTARSNMVAMKTNSRPEGRCDTDIFDEMLLARWAGAIAPSPPFDSTMACSVESRDAENIWKVATMSYMDAVMRDGLGAVSRTLKWAEQLEADERNVEAKGVQLLAKAVAYTLSNIVQVPVRYRALKHRQSRPNEVVMATIISSVDGAGHWVLDTVQSVDGTKVLAALGEVSSRVIGWGKLYAGKGYGSTMTVANATSNALVSAANYVISRNVGPRFFVWYKTLDEAVGPKAGGEGSEGQSMAEKFLRCTKVRGGPEPAPDSTEAQLLFGAWV